MTQFLCAVILCIAALPGATVAQVSITHRDFHGRDAVVLRNHAAEAVVVPAIGRIMQFSLLDAKGNAEPGPLWNNPALETLKPDARTWLNYGGDKTWPSPQIDWPKMIGRAWPPPGGFDATAYEASVDGSKLQLLSPVDHDYGIQVRRTITLDPQKPILTVVTAYEKVDGPPVRAGVWTIAQVRSPERAFILVPRKSVFPKGYVGLLTPLPKDLKTEHRILSLSRDPVNKTMIGSDGQTLLWVGDGPDLLIEQEGVPPASGKVEWPEHGSHSKIYTNSGSELAYIELELLDWLHDLKPGENTLMTCTYTLIRRTESNPLHEAKKVLGHKM